MYRIKVILISVVSFPLSTSLTNWASICIWTCALRGNKSVPRLTNGQPGAEVLPTISSAPLNTPQSMLEYHSSSCARPSSGSSTKSANGFSSKMSENCLLSAVQPVIVGVVLRKILKPTCERAQYDTSTARNASLSPKQTFEIISAVSRRLAHRPAFDFAKKSSISRRPML